MLQRPGRFPHLVRHVQTSASASDTSFRRFLETGGFLTLNLFVFLSLAALLALGWLLESWTQALLNLLFILGFAG